MPLRVFPKNLRLVLLGLAVLLAACSAPVAEVTPPTPAYELVGEALARPGPRDASVLGYVARDGQGFRLIGGLRSEPGGPQPVAEDEQVCLELAPGELAGAAGTAGASPYLLAAVSGRLEAGGAGPCRMRIVGARTRALSPREATVETLVKRPGDYAGEPVRVTGALLARPGAALLLERIGDGGAPAPGALQVKLAGTLPEAALPDALRHSASGDVRFGRVQVEGLWRDGALLPLAIFAVTE